MSTTPPPTPPAAPPRAGFLQGLDLLTLAGNVAWRVGEQVLAALQGGDSARLLDQLAAILPTEEVLRARDAALIVRQQRLAEELLGGGGSDAGGSSTGG